MNPAALLAAASPPLASRLGLILRGLAALITRRFLRDPLRAPLIVPLWRCLTRAATRLEGLHTRLAAGPLPAPKPRAGKSSGPHRKPALPTTHAWLIRALGAEAAAYASQLEALLADPEAAELIALPAARRSLAPVRRMLGLAPRPAAAPRRPRAAKPAPAPIPNRPTLDPPAPHRRTPWWCPPPRLRSG